MFAAGASAVVAFSDDDAVQKACKEVANGSVNFVWTQLRALGTFLGVRSQHVKEAAKAAAGVQQATLPPDQHAHASDTNTNGTASEAMPDRQQQSQQHQQPQQQEVQQQGQPAEPAGSEPAASKSQAERPPSSGQAPAAQQNGNSHKATPVQQAATAPANAVASSQPNAANSHSNGAGPQAKPVAERHRHTVEEEVHQHTESHEVVEPSNGDSPGQQGATSTIVHRHSLTKKRKRTDEHEAEAVAAAPDGHAPETPQAAAGTISTPEGPTDGELHHLQCPSADTP